MHKLAMMVLIPDEKLEYFNNQLIETGHVQFTFRDATIFAEMYYKGGDQKCQQ